MRARAIAVLAARSARRVRPVPARNTRGTGVAPLRSRGRLGPSASGVRWTYLTAGDRIDFASGSVTRAGAPLTGTGAAPAEIGDAWDSIDGPGNVYSLRDLARAFVATDGAAATGVTFETAPRYRTTLTRDAASAAWTTAEGVSFERLLVAIDAVP